MALVKNHKFPQEDSQEDSQDFQIYEWKPKKIIDLIPTCCKKINTLDVQRCGHIYRGNLCQRPIWHGTNNCGFHQKNKN